MHFSYLLNRPHILTVGSYGSGEIHRLPITAILPPHRGNDNAIPVVVSSHLVSLRPTINHPSINTAYVSPLS
jgi:hypothetical protein